jgi:hypothetical protein
VDGAVLFFLFFFLYHGVGWVGGGIFDLLMF